LSPSPPSGRKKSSKNSWLSDKYVIIKFKTEFENVLLIFNIGGDKMKRLTLLWTCLLLAIPCSAGVITVDDDGPADFSNIQAAVDAADNGDTIIVADGTYASEGWQNNPVIDFSGKAITVRSENGPENCILYRGDHVVRFNSAETQASVLSGFTITGADPGGGIGCYDSSPTIMNNIITGNWSEYGLGAVLLHNSSAVVVGNIISGNAVYGPCAGIFCCHGSAVTITNNTILWSNGDYDLYNCSATYSCIEHPSAGVGNIHTDPMFINPDDGDYHLQSGSLCIDAGNNSAVLPSMVVDIDGNSRISNGTVDMGAYESASTAPQPVLFVDDGATGANNGSSWINAFTDLQQALAVATAFSEVEEIRVAQGVYTPAEPSGDRTATFQLISGVAIKGGYAGVGAPDPDARDINAYETILSGDLNGDDGPNFTNNNENSRHVVTGNGTNITAILDGFIITAGYADGVDGMYPFINNGAGIYNEYGSPTVTNCTFTGNVAVLHDYEYGGRGAGMYNEHSNPIVGNCTFSGNVAGGQGGGMYNYYSSPTISNCVIRENEGCGIAFMHETETVITNCELIGNTYGYGAGINCEYGSSPVISNCTFVGNSAQYDGGGLRCYVDCAPTVTSCTFSANTATIQHGGAISNYASAPTVSNCTFTGNSAGRKGGGIFCYRESNPNVTNCILWGNSSLQGSQIALWYYDVPGSEPSPAAITVSYSDVQGGASAVDLDSNCTLNWGTGNIDVDPCFVDSAADDYHLLPTSPCINTGDPNYVAGPNETDLDGQPRVTGSRIDMGAYEFLGPTILYVDADATGNNDGSSWANAFNYLQDALFNASPDIEIRVAEGIYKPHQDSYSLMPPNRMQTFQLKNGVTMKGGYAGFGASDPDARDINTYETILSGDLNGNDVGDLHDESRAENNFHVVTGSGTDPSAVLDGFTITAGNAYNNKCSIYDNGGGMYNHSGSPTVINCTFTRNTASDQCGGGGGGMYNNQSNPTVINCTFTGNEYIIADDDGGGGMCNYESNPTLIDCIFTDNASNGDGGGMLNSNSNPTLIRCTFINNSSAHEGGAMENGHSNPVLTHCVFLNNSAFYEGGGMRNARWSSPTLLGCAFIGNSVAYGYSHGGGICNNYQDSPTLISCLFTGNSAQQGGGMYSYWGTATLTNCTFSGNSAADKGGAMYYRSDSSTLTNCIVWGNAANQGDEIYFEFFENPATMTVSHSDIRGGSAGIHIEPGNTLSWATGNIDVDPCFVESAAGDYYLLTTSPCINTGDPNYVAEPNETDLDGQPRVIGGRVDMGAYEFQGPRIYYVDDDAVGNNNGSSWDNAFNYLQDALDAASSGDEIWVAQGIYKPDQGGGSTSGDPTATFHLINSVAIKGGYAGVGEPDPDARDINAYETILSGDLNGNNASDSYEESIAENSYHVVTGSGTDANTVLDGFTITGGNTHDWPTYNGAGAGMYNHTGSPTLTNCTFIGNSADVGGGMFNHHGSNPMLTNCMFIGNSADARDGHNGYGGGMANDYDSNPTLTNCTFSENSAVWSGAGMSNYVSSPTFTNCTFSGNSTDNYGGGMSNGGGTSNPILTNCTFTGNSARLGGGVSGGGMLINCVFNSNTAEDGGGMWNGEAAPTLTNCIFTGNSASGYGGGMYNIEYSSPTLTNCTFSGNSAGDGGGMCNIEQSNPTLTNCILWSNSPQQIVVDDSTPLVTYSDVQGSWPGEGNIDADPLFVDAAGGNCHLLPTSPCVNAGDPNFIAEPDQTDIDGQPRVINGRIDMGADEVVIAATKFTPQTLNPCSKGNWVKAHLVLPLDFTVEDVNTHSPAVLEPLGIESNHMNVSVGEDGLTEVEIFFDRSAFCGVVVDNQPIEVTVVGVLTSGQYFYGTDTIRIITNNRRYLAVLASHWLEDTCDQSDWCGGADLDLNSTVDFVDFAMFSGCCFEIVEK
jgi:hypothetical protein